jgi:hypothetical protein
MNPEPISVNDGVVGFGDPKLVAPTPVQTGRGDTESVPFRRSVIAGCCVLLDVQAGSANASAARAVTLRMGPYVARTAVPINPGDNVAPK